MKFFKIIILKILLILLLTIFYYNCVLDGCVMTGFILNGYIYDVTDDPISDISVDVIEVSGSSDLPTHGLIGKTELSNIVGYYEISTGYGVEFEDSGCGVPRKYLTYIDNVKVKYSKTGYIDKVVKFHFDDVEDPGTIKKNVTLLNE